MHVLSVSVLDKLIILSKFVTEKEMKKKKNPTTETTTTAKNTLTLQQNNCFV